MNIRRLTFAGLLVAIGTLTAHLIYIPAGVSKCFPVQHAINVIAAVLLGPGPAVAIAFVISCFRNMFGTGSLLAFPGSMIGALCAGLLYCRWGKLSGAVVGEVFGTGILGGFVAWIIAAFFIPPFLISTAGGSFLAWLLLKTGAFAAIRDQLK